MNTWGKWPDELHYDYEQVTRIESAKDKKIQKGILEVNREKQYIVIQGSEAEPYRATLKFCDCRDFELRHKPCKHMYRLAMELNLLEVPELHEDFDKEAEIERYKKLYMEGKISGKLYSTVCKALK